MHKDIRATLLGLAERSSTPKVNFYKTGIGHYAEHDKFIGVPVPVLRKLAKELKVLPIAEISLLLSSSINEERLLALFILVDQYKLGNAKEKESIYQFYIDNLKHVNNWNLVDASAHLIVGAHLLNKDKAILVTMSESPILWDRRVSIIATWWFIRNGQFQWTLKIAEVLLSDSHDLIHKAVGWMLREIGKRDTGVLKGFLDKNVHNMPRTMLRYAIEKFPKNERLLYLKMRESRL